MPNPPRWWSAPESPRPEPEDGGQPSPARPGAKDGAQHDQARPEATDGGRHHQACPALEGGRAVPRRAPGTARRPTRNHLLALAALTLVTGLAGGLLGAALRAHTALHADVRLPRAPAVPSRPPQRGSLAQVAARALPGVVYVHAVRGRAETIGAGFVLDGRGDVLTNAHVLGAPHATLSVTFYGGGTRPVRVVGRDAADDLAVLRVTGVRGLRALELGSSGSVRVGDPVVAIGAPYDLEGTVTSGIVSAVRRPIATGGGSDSGKGGGAADLRSYTDAVQTDAPINPGNSGGPLLDARGAVIGVNCAMRAADDASGDGQGGSIGLGFAIPVDEARRVAQELIASGHASHPVLGARLDPGWGGAGARVVSVTPGGPAAGAGVRAGDVVVRAAGQPVGSAVALLAVVRSLPPGERLALGVRRAGHPVRAVAVLGRSR
jgi:putative serine protease PepD